MGGWWWGRRLSLAPARHDLLGGLGREAVARSCAEPLVRFSRGRFGQQTRERGVSSRQAGGDSFTWAGLLTSDLWLTWVGSEAQYMGRIRGQDFAPTAQ